MGLDMYLVGKKHLWSKWEEETGKPYGIRQDLAKLFPELVSHPDLGKEYSTEGDVSYIESTLLYWRKANHIHKWFIDNVQGGIDNCGDYRVSRDELVELLATCKEVLETKNTEKLPTQGGFFFGSTDYDEYYYRQVEHTISRLEYILGKDESGEERFKGWNFEYSSSW